MPSLFFVSSGIVIMDRFRNVRKLIRRLTLCRALTRVYDRISGPMRLGDLGEREAERFLLRQGWIIVGRGYEDWFGEIDLIAVDDRTLVFVEVKTRSSDITGDPSEAVDTQKQIHLIKTAQGFLKRKNLTECPTRFDVISILWPDTNQPPELRHFKHAFEPGEAFQLA